VKGIKKLGDILGRFTGVVNVISYVSMGFMVLLTVADVLLRYFFNSPITGAYEVNQYALLVAVFASLSHAQTSKGHVNVTVLLVKFPRRIKYVVYTLVSAMGALVVAAASIAAGRQAQIAAARGYITSTLKFVTAPFIWAQCLLLGVFALAILYEAVCGAAAIFDDAMAQDVSEDWL
jgi:TRAP-type C4-dicarboxylate transport system permease small subunit